MKVQASDFQIHVISQHFLPFIPGYATNTMIMNALFQQLGEKRVQQALQVVPPNGGGFAKAQEQLNVLETFWNHPDRFEVLSQTDLDGLQQSDPEISFADGEVDFFCLDKITYRYRKSEIDRAGAMPRFVSLSISDGNGDKNDPEEITF